MSNTLQLELLDKKLDRIRDSIDQFASSFYENLLRAHPEFKNLFNQSDMAEQKKMLAGILTLVIRNWQKPQMLSSSLKRLGARHVKYGPLSKYYPLFGEVLLDTFKQYLGSDWTTEMKQAWTEVYDSITKLMLEGYNEAKANVYFTGTTCIGRKGHHLVSNLEGKNYKK